MKYCLGVGVLAIVLGLSAAACTAADVSKPDCKKWVFEARNAVEAVPMKQRYRKVIEEMAKACPSISLGLREAAQKSLMKDGTVSKRILLNVAAPYFHPACPPQDPNTPAIHLLKSCSDDTFSEGLLRHLDAATFFYGRALKKEFQKAGIYKNYGATLIGYLYLTNADYWESVASGEMAPEK